MKEKEEIYFINLDYSTYEADHYDSGTMEIEFESLDDAVKFQKELIKIFSKEDFFCTRDYDLPDIISDRFDFYDRTISYTALSIYKKTITIEKVPERIIKINEIV